MKTIIKISKNHATQINGLHLPIYSLYGKINGRDLLPSICRKKSSCIFNAYKFTYNDTMYYYITDKKRLEKTVGLITVYVYTPSMDKFEAVKVYINSPFIENICTQIQKQALKNSADFNKNCVDHYTRNQGSVYKNFKYWTESLPKYQDERPKTATVWEWSEGVPQWA